MTAYRHVARRRSVLRRLYWGPVAIAIWALLIWELASRAGMVDEIVLPAPTDIAADVARFATAPFYWDAMSSTLSAAFFGLVIGAFLGISLGVMFSLWPVSHRAGMPMVVAYEFTPKSALAPVFVAWLGFGLGSKVAVAAAICFFPLLMNTLAAFRSTDPDLAAVMKVLGASKVQTLRFLHVPGSLPVMFGGFRVAASLALIGAIVAEFVVGGSGVGGLILDYTWAIDVPAVFALIISLGVIGLALYWALGWAEHRLVHWREPDDPDGAQATV